MMEREGDTMMLANRMRWTWLPLAFCLLLASAACGKGDGANNANTGGSETDEAAKGKGDAKAAGPKTLNLGVAGDPETLDVGKMSGAPEGRVAFNAFEGLWMPAQSTGKPVYGAAESHTISEDGKTWTIKLRKDAKWSNGDPVTADDFAFAWKRVATPGFDADYAEFMDFIAGMESFRKKEWKALVGDEAKDEVSAEDAWAKVGVKVKDPQTLEVTLVNPTPFFPELMAFYTFFPVHKASVEKHGDSWTDPANIVTNGPFTLKEYKLQQHLLLTQNTHYWDKANVKIEQIKIFIIKDNISMLNAFKEGKIDIMAGGIPISKLPKWKGKDEFRLDPMLGTYYYRINVTANDALKKKAVRQALALAIDRNSLARLTMKGLYDPANGFVPPMENFTNPTKLSYDPKRARELMTEAGYEKGKDFPTITLLFNSDENHKLIAEIIQDTWKRELGIDVKLENKEWKTYLTAIDKLNYEVARAGWIGDYNDPTTFLGIFTTGNGNNDTGWGNPEFDKLIAGAYAEVDAAKRRKMLEDAEKIMMDEMPIIPIYYYKTPNLIGKRVIGHKPHNRDVHLAKYMDLK